MLRFDLPYTDSSLLLTPRFGDHSVAAHALRLAVCLAPVLLVSWLYRYELRLVRRSAARLLLALRMLVVLMLVTVVTFQPVVARPTVESLPGRVVVALDRSDSMGVTDPQRPVADKLRLALALHLVRDLSSDAELGGWMLQTDSKGQIHWPSESATSAEERQRLDRVCQRIDGLSRADVARAVLSADGGGLLAAVDRRHGLDFIGFAAAGGAIDPTTIGNLPPIGDAGGVTDLRVPLARGREGGDRKATAVVLLTDGQHNDPASPVEQAAELGRDGVPVYPIAIGAKVPPTDIAVTQVQAPATVFKGSDAGIEARVEVRGLSARTIEVELQRNGQPPLVETLAHDGTDRGYSVRFSPRLDDVGTQVMTVHARPAVEELRTENNSRPVVVNVADDRARVLLIDGEARWEFHYLASALARDRGIELTTVVFEQPRTGRLGEAQLRAAGHPARHLPSEPDALDRFECIILGDVTPQQLSTEDAARLERFVGERGGTLVILAGRRAMPVAYLGSAAEADPLRKLLPIEGGQTVDAPGGFPVVLTAEGTAAPFLRMEPTADESERRWAALPRHFWGVAGRAKPGATVLATVRSPAEAKPGDPAGWARDNALMVRQNYGFGRVLYVGMDSTWRWRFKVGDTYHHRFWGQAIRWAASDTPLLTGNAFVRFGPRKPIVTQGQDIEFGVRLSEQGRRLFGDSPAKVRIVRAQAGKAEESATDVDLHAVPGRSGEMEARARDLPPGQYAAELVISTPAGQAPISDGQAGPLRAPFTVSPRPSTEMVDLATNLPLLEEIAAKSGGRVFAAEAAGELADLLARTTSVHEADVETKLWQAWPTLIAFLVLLTTEWLVRKWAGLP